ncbi:MAG TPA: ester cyclase [Blastocatellia bacterium]|nr:ester cyclase [Blastocatellia bacterium]
MALRAVIACRWKRISLPSDDIIAEEDKKVVTRMRWSATLSDSFMGVPPAGNRITCTVAGVARPANEKIVEHWGVTDELAMWAQMGLLPEEFLAAMG